MALNPRLAIAFGHLVCDKNLLGHYQNIIFKDCVFIYPPKQVVHYDIWLFHEGFEERGTWTYTSLKNLQQGIHAITLHLQHRLTNCLMKSHNDSFSSIMMFCKVHMLCFYWVKHKQFATNASETSLNELTKFQGTS